MVHSKDDFFVIHINDFLFVYKEIDCLLVAGDVFDAFNPPAIAERLFYDALDRLAGGGRL